MFGLEAGGAGRCWLPVGGGGVHGTLVHNDLVGEGLGLEAGGAGWCWPAAGGGGVLGLHFFEIVTLGGGPDDGSNHRERTTAKTIY